MWGDYAPVGLGIITIGLLVYVLRKVTRLHRVVREVEASLGNHLSHKTSTLFSQLEALHALQMALGLEKPLPPTRGWAISPDLLVLLANHVLHARPKLIVECGSGVSTIVLARSVKLAGAGHVYSLEHLEDFAAATRDQLEAHGLADFATVIYAPFREYRLGGQSWLWYSLDGFPDSGIDLLLVDGPPASEIPLARYPAGPLLFPRLNPGAAVFLDDADRKGEGAIVDYWAREFPSMRHETERTEKGCVVLHQGLAFP